MQGDLRQIPSQKKYHIVTPNTINACHNRVVGTINSGFMLCGRAIQTGHTGQFIVHRVWHFDTDNGNSHPWIHYTMDLKSCSTNYLVMINLCVHLFYVTIVYVVYLMSLSILTENQSPAPVPFLSSGRCGCT